jgi:hypothetical protein
MSDDNVITLHNETRLDLPPERILTAAIEAKVEPVVIVGLGEDGELYFASTTGDAGAVLMLLERAKKALIEAE